jgi:translation initiation factor IF-2
LAKNLKLNIKNAQLAEALKLNKLKRAPAPKKRKEEIAAPPPALEEKVQEKPVEEIKIAKVEPAVPVAEEPPPAEPLQKAAISEEKPAPPPQPKPPLLNRPYEQRPYPQKPYERPRPAAAPFPRREGPPAAPYTPGAPRAPYVSRPRPLPRRPITPSMPPPAKPITKREEKPVKRPQEFSSVKEYRDLKPQKKAEMGRAFDSRDKQGLRDIEGEGWRKKRPSHKFTRSLQEEVVVRPKSLHVRLPITVKDLASAMKLKASELIAKLFMQGAVITLNDYLTDETAVQLLGTEFDCDITIDTSEEERLRITDKTIKQEVQASDASLLSIRPPVVAFMGHVDHGKTSLIDAIRKTNVASNEAGAITQHIGAFKCHTAVGDITILDTPGHEAFSAMRARGADVTDIVVLVIAGDEGIRTQTLEAIEQAKTATIPIVVAINKCDKPNFNAENIYRQLSEQNLLPEVWGGTTITINCSAVTGAGIKELLEMLALQSEILELKANPKTRARGTVIESEMHKGLGAVATILIQNGTLRLGDSLVFARHWARVKTMHDENGRELLEAGPSTPVKITGLSGLPDAGSEFIVVRSEREARELAEERSQDQKNISLLQKKKIGLESLLQQEASRGAKKILNLILRADVQGSLEALKTSLMKISSSKVDLNIISEGVGEISESDIQLAAASKGTIIGFHTQIESHAESLIKQMKVIVRLHDIIYHAVDDVKEIMVSLLEKIPQETDIGSALVKTTFKASQLGLIAGCQVIEGTIKRNSHIRVIRDKHVIWKGTITSLKRVKEDVREVTKGLECGILLQDNNDIKENDILQAYEITYLTQTL